MKAVRVVAKGHSFIDPSASSSRSTNVVTELSPREVEVIRELVFGRTNREIAARLFISEETVKTDVGHLLTKLQLQNRGQLIAHALKCGGVDVAEL